MGVMNPGLVMRNIIPVAMTTGMMFRVMNPGLVMRNIIPVVMAGVLGIYGLIVAVILQGSISKPEEANGAFTTKFSSFSGYAYLSAGLCCGLSGLAAGMAIGVVGD